MRPRDHPGLVEAMRLPRTSVSLAEPRGRPCSTSTTRGHGGRGGPPGATAVGRSDRRDPRSRSAVLSQAQTASRTIDLGYGELRSRGSYVAAPPSIHPTGREYVWLLGPTGRLPAVPEFIAKKRRLPAAARRRCVERGPPGQMYDYLLDKAVRLARAGEADPAVIEAALVAIFEQARPRRQYGDPAAGRRDTRRMAEWAADRDRDRETRREAPGRPLPISAPARSGVRHDPQLLEDVEAFVRRFIVFASDDQAPPSRCGCAHACDRGGRGHAVPEHLQRREAVGKEPAARTAGRARLERPSRREHQ